MEKLRPQSSLGALGAGHAADVRSVFRQLLQALGFLHAQRIVHRDVKPENVMLQVSSGAEVGHMRCSAYIEAAAAAAFVAAPLPRRHLCVRITLTVSYAPSAPALQALNSVRIVLLDFGISRDTARRIRTATMTRLVDPTRMGTVPYASPEALGGRRREEAAAPADMFAVGVMALEARCLAVPPSCPFPASSCDTARFQ